MDTFCNMRKNCVYKLILLLLAFVTIYNELIALKLKVSSWDVLEEPVGQLNTHHNGVPVRLLLVSDPQMLSTLTEPFYPFSLLAVWDANRFLVNGFQAAVNRVKPDVVVFLGDLINDGSVADEETFKRLTKDFKTSFSTPNSVKLKVYIPGDNDIGGEGKDLIADNKINRFQQAFPNTATEYKFLRFIQISSKTDKVVPHWASVPGVYKILLSHVPLMPGVSQKQTIQDEQPSLILSGHHHQSLRFVGPKADGHASQFWPLRGNDTKLNFTLLEEDLNELVIPTCSYRMGKNEYGYGMAVIDSRGWVQYNVLWLPCRFTQLSLYCGIIIFSVVVLILPRLYRIVYVIINYIKFWREGSLPYRSPNYVRIVKYP